jgi:hypothetical protein
MGMLVIDLRSWAWVEDLRERRSLPAYETKLYRLPKPASMG